MKTVLLADNDKDYRNTLSNILKNAGYKVFTAKNPVEARSVLDSQAIDLAILDQRLDDDKDSLDQSGFEIAKEDKYRYLPKIILTAFPVSPAEISKSMDWDIGKMPAVIKIISKTEGTAEVLEFIEDTFTDWRNLKILTKQISNKIDEDYKSTRNQARYNFVVTSIVSIIGIIIVFLGIIMAGSMRLEIGLVVTASGVITEVLGYLFHRRLDTANQRMDQYHFEQLQIYWFEVLLATSEDLPVEIKIENIQKIIQNANNTWLGNKKTSSEPALITKE